MNEVFFVRSERVNMKKATCQKNKLNNAGLTLVEILVAITILTVAIIPLMHSFIYVARHNVKSRDLQQTTVLSHTVIENCKSYTLQEIEASITDSTAPTYPFLKNADASVKDTINSTATTTYYHFDNVKMYSDGAGNVSNQVYDVRMTIEPAAGSEQLMMSYEDMNAYRDAVFMAETATTNTSPALNASDLDGIAHDRAIAAIKALVSSHSMAAHGFQVNMTDTEVVNSFQSGGLNAGNLSARKYITVTASEGAGGVQTVDMNWEYKYSVAGGSFTYELTHPVTGVVSTDTVTIPAMGLNSNFNFAIYNNSETKDKTDLENIYLFYYPAYSNEHVTAYPYLSEEISIENNLSDSVNVYLIKQSNPTMTKTELHIAETIYSPILKGNDLTGGGGIKVYHNQDENLGGGSTTGWSDLNATGLELIDYDRDPSPTVVDEESLINVETKQLMYRVVVDIYDSSAFQSTSMTMNGEPLSSMSATFLNW